MLATALPDKPATDNDARRFLQQAAFSYSDADVARVKDIGYSAWIDEQINLAEPYSHLAAQNALASGADSRTSSSNDVAWLGLVTAKSQIRQKWMFALSQIFVVSARDGVTFYYGRAVAQYMDDLQNKGFGNFRDLLETVTLSQAMGQFLSHNFNDKENAALGTVPDQNYAREVMQLFTIGLWKLNNDGSRALDGNGKPIPTFGQSDVVGASRVLTGFASPWANAAWSNNSCNCPNTTNIAHQSAPMIAFDNHHSTLEKSFLGTKIAAGSSDATGDLKMFLDTLFNHANVGPFISKQLIQRLVTSNPSPAYVGRVAAAFNNNGSGVRGDMKAVLKAILLDVEARDNSYVGQPTYGRIREPVQRAVQLIRTFGGRAEANPNSLKIPEWIFERRKGLWQSPFGSPTVFNFYSPDYAPQGSMLAKQASVSPEMQITTQTSIGDIDWFFWALAENGGLTDCCSDAARNTYYLRLDYSNWLALTDTPDALADKLSATFMAGQMSAALKAKIVRVVNAMNAEKAQTSGMTRGRQQLKLGQALRALLMSPDYVVQK